jgi:hypothetical protein
VPIRGGRLAGVLVIAWRAEVVPVRDGNGRGAGHGLDGVTGAGQGREAGRSASYVRDGGWVCGDGLEAGRGSDIG